MKKLKTGTITALTAAMFGMALISTAQANSISIDFETPPGTTYELFFGASQSTDQSLSPTHSAQLNDPVNSSLVRIIPSGLKLGSTEGSFGVYLPTGTNLNVAPYMIFGADVDGSGVWDSSLTNDALVIAFISGPFSADTWFQTGLNSSTNVHVVGNRPGLTLGEYSSSGTQDTLAALSAESTGSGLWGDLGLLRIYVEIGEWPGVTTYNSYVDDINVSAVPEPGAVPEPATLALLMFGLAGLGLSRRKQA